MADAIGIAATALTVHRKWLDAIADNLANANTVTATSGDAFRARYVLAEAGLGNSGVYVAGAAYGDAAGRVVHEPGHPLADAEGNVRYPDIDVASQMSQLIMAQRGYQANAGVVDRAKTMYEAGLQIGK
ncbi:flagellar basal body rod protein FlgC [Arthrobacter sp. STN4]|uniref:flagellar basal body rod protein FlgC n=1 Tax=Arthrobacter sp. STN4 TaxID=2923276 RepID=UPI002119C66C|nr:flagellar basal body rod C-terminal domain-containing protein [Arthrobacter sp. STN4]MCQ9162499.1 flagellar basal body protein [Arthrobacter sp. STN4]